MVFYLGFGCMTLHAPSRYKNNTSSHHQMPLYDGPFCNCFTVPNFSERLGATYHELLGYSYISVNSRPRLPLALFYPLLDLISGVLFLFSDSLSLHSFSGSFLFIFYEISQNDTEEMRFPEFIRSAGLASNDRPLAGVAGFEPTNKGVKVLCLTAWRYPFFTRIELYHKFICLVKPFYER